MTNVIEMPQARDARHPADQPSDEMISKAIKAVIDAKNETYVSGKENPPADDAVKVSQQPAKETPPSVRTLARQQGIDLRGLLGILELQRPAGSDTEDQFVKDVIGKIDGIQKDEYGNHYLIIGDNPNIMWSCHTDTVARQDGRQNIKWDGDFLVLNDPKTGQCLGADDGAGIWLLMEMIKAKVPGLYIFHREEEIGGRGSDYIVDNNKELVKDIKMAIAFDRRDVDSVITHQGGQRTCSKKFADAMCEKLNQVDGLKYCLDNGGSFTDTKNYVELIAECTNISCGYYSEHSTREKLDVRHLLRLREALISYDFSDLPVDRDPTTTEYDDWGYGWGGGGYRSMRREYVPQPKTKFEKLEQMVRDRPHSIAKMLFNMGMDADQLETMLYNLWYRKPVTEDDTFSSSTSSNSTRRLSLVDDNQHEQDTIDWLRRNDVVDPDEDEEDDNIQSEERLWCNSCGFWSDLDYVSHDGECQHCGDADTELVECEVDTFTGEVVQ